MKNPLPTVVVVDDSAAVREFFERTVAPLNVELKTFSTASASLEFLKNVKPALLFLDIIMPDKDGLTLLQELRKLNLQKDTAVVMVSSKDYAQDRMVARNLGAVEFVAKPMSQKTIRDLIMKYANPGTTAEAATPNYLPNE